MNVTVPDDLYQRAAAVAEREHKSVDDLVAAWLTDVLASREYIEARARSHDRSAFEAALRSIPDVEPEEYDRL